MSKRLDALQPSHRHWELLRLHDLKRLHPSNFLQKWNVSRHDLAEICDCGIDTVNHWFSKSTGEKIPHKYLRRLAEVDYIWSSLEQVPEHLKELYNRRNEKDL